MQTGRRGTSSRVLVSRSKPERQLVNTTKADTALKKQKKLLLPHILSARLKTLCDKGGIETAVVKLKNAPLDAQNTPVWNTMIWECMIAQHFSLAYKLFTDMKRRGFTPTTRTYQTMFMGLSRIEHWPSHIKQLNNAHMLYTYFVQHLEQVKKHEPHSEELTVTPLASYIKILGDAGEYQKIFDVYYAMQQDGALAPNVFIFTSMFQAFSKRRTASGDERIDSSTVHHRNASDAVLLWRQMLKRSQKSPGFEIDSHTIAAALKAMSQGRPVDQSVALDIVYEYLGLAKPDEDPLPTKASLTSPTLEAVLELCSNMQKHDLCIHFVQQIIKRPLKPGEVSIVDRGHMDRIIKAHGSIAATGSMGESIKALRTLQWMLREEVTGTNGIRIRPAKSTFKLALMVCWRNADWHSATKVFELMSGYHSRDFLDTKDTQGILQTYKMEKRSKGRNLPPDAEAMSYMVRTALATRDRSAMRQCLRIVDLIGTDHFFLKDDMKRQDVSSSKDYQTSSYQAKLAIALTETVDYVLARGVTSGPEVDRWRALRASAKEVLRAVAKFRVGSPLSST